MSHSKLALFLFATGCSSAALPELPPEVPQAIEVAQCVHDALQGVDPEALTLAEAIALGVSLKDCLPAPVGDAGAR